MLALLRIKPGGRWIVLRSPRAAQGIEGDVLVWVLKPASQRELEAVELSAVRVVEIHELLMSR